MSGGAAPSSRIHYSFVAGPGHPYRNLPALCKGGQARRSATPPHLRVCIPWGSRSPCIPPWPLRSGKRTSMRGVDPTRRGAAENAFSPLPARVPSFLSDAFSASSVGIRTTIGPRQNSTLPVLKQVDALHGRTGPWSHGNASFNAKGRAVAGERFVFSAPCSWRSPQNDRYIRRRVVPEPQIRRAESPASSVPSIVPITEAPGTRNRIVGYNGA